MTVNEDTGEDVVCPICDAAEWFECGHLVASFDRNFCECQGGAIYSREGEFLSIIEGEFLSHLQNGTEPSFRSSNLEELWKSAKSTSKPEEGYVDLDGYILQRFLIELLEEAGAYELPGSLIDPGGPGMTSSISPLFAEKPSEVVGQALRQLSGEFNKEPRSKAAENRAAASPHQHPTPAQRSESKS